MPARMDILLLTLIIYLCSYSRACTLSTYGNGKIHANCRQQGLSGVPTNFTKDSLAVVSLDLSHNDIRSLGRAAFSHFPNLVTLDLSSCGIDQVHEQFLEGLSQLDSLDLTNNTFLGVYSVDRKYRKIPGGIFLPVRNLTKLIIRGGPIKGNVFVPLKKLKQLTVETNGYIMPYELVNITSLRVLNFVKFHARDGVLTKDMMQPFARGNLEEISFFASTRLQTLQNGVFGGFAKLKLLNFAHSAVLNVSHILIALSSCEGLRLESLILDVVNWWNLESFVILGTVENGSCPRIWKTVRNLSIRGIRLLGFQTIRCFANLRKLSIGYNSPFIWPEKPYSTNIQRMRHLQYIDLSNLYVSEYSNFRHSDLLPINQNYFPETVPEWESVDCDPDETDPIAHLNNAVTANHIFHFAPCLLYIRADHIAHSSLFRVKTNTSVTIANNNLRYLNTSHTSGQLNLVFNNEIEGLNKLEVIDMTDMALLFINPHSFQNFPSIKKIYLGANKLGDGSKSLALFFSNLQFLQLIDLSDNRIRSINTNMFVNLSSLHELYLSGNYIHDIMWLAPTLHSLVVLDIQKNKLEYFSSDELHTVPFLTNRTSLVMNIDGNPLQCGCAQSDFVSWLKNTKIQIMHKDQLSCQNSGIHVAVNEVDLTSQCDHIMRRSHMLIVSAITVCSTTVLITTSLLVYRFRWTIKWWYYKKRYISRKRNRRYDNVLMDVNNVNECIFSCFVIYAEADDAIRGWVVQTLRNQIVNHWRRKECYIRGLTDMPGQYHIEGIVEGLTHSMTALWIISPSFFEDSWCEMAANYAMSHLGVTNNALLIMENRFEQYRVPQHFASLMSPKFKTLTLRYTDDNNGQRVFWSDLDNFIPT